jgi:hypothetical protein
MRALKIKTDVLRRFWLKLVTLFCISTFNARCILEPGERLIHIDQCPLFAVVPG